MLKSPKNLGIIRDDSEFRWNTAPGGSDDLEGTYRWVMVNKNSPEPVDCGSSFLNGFISDKKVLGLDEFDQIEESCDPYKKTRTYGLQRISDGRENNE